MKQPTQIFKSTVHAYSDVYGSRQKAEYAIGRPDGARASCFNLSENEVKEILDNLPEEFEIKAPEKDNETSKDVNETTIDSGQLNEFMNQEEEKNLEDMSVPELRKEAKSIGISGYSDMRRDELVKAIYAELSIPESDSE